MTGLPASPIETRSDVDDLLALVAGERALRNRPDFVNHLDEHGEACNAVWDALYAMLDARRGVVPKRPPTDPVKMARKEVAAELKRVLPAMIAQAIEDL